MPGMSAKGEARERILIIEDSVDTVALLRNILRPLKYRTSCAMNGKDGLAKALDEQPDLILLDLNLPHLSGMEVLEALRQSDCPSPVILMTVHGSESVAVRAFRLGVRDYVTKPFKIDDLLAAVERALKEGRLRRERKRLVAELSQANWMLRQQMRELATLQAIGRSVASLITREKLLRRIIDAAIYLAGADAGAVFLLDRASGELCLEAARQGKTYHSGRQIRIKDSHVQDVLHSGQPLWLSGPAGGTNFAARLGQEAHSLLYVPINLGDRAVGAMGIAYLQESREFPSEIQNRLTALADYAAIALRNAQLYGNSQQQTERLATLNHIAGMVTSSLDLEEVMWAVVRSVNDILRVETGSLVLLDEESDELVFEITLQGDTEKLAPFRMKVGQGIVGWVVQTGQSVRVNDVSNDPRFYDGVDQAIGFRTHCILCVPLTIPGKIIGAIEVINKIDDLASDGLGQFTEQDEELLHATAAFVAMAVENARLHEAMRDTIASQTVHDTVTTLSHYVNNPLQALMGIAQSLKKEYEVADLIECKVKEIAAAISVLQDITSPESTVYLGSIQMLDIEKELQARLSSEAARLLS